MKGEGLRSRRDPSVSELLARRVLEIAHAPRPRTTPNVELEMPAGWRSCFTDGIRKPPCP